MTTNHLPVQRAIAQPIRLKFLQPTTTNHKQPPTKMPNYLPIQRATAQPMNKKTSRAARRAQRRYRSGYGDFLEQLEPTTELKKHLKRSNLLDLPALPTADIFLKPTQRINLIILSYNILVKRPGITRDDITFIQRERARLERHLILIEDGQSNAIKGFLKRIQKPRYKAWLQELLCATKLSSSRKKRRA
jgi:hypothetical protein